MRTIAPAQFEPTGPRRARIILGIAATALLIFMGLTVVKALRGIHPSAVPATPRRGAAPADRAALDTSNLRTMSDPHFTVGFSARTDKSDAQVVMKILDAARSDLAHRLAAAQLSIETIPRLDIVLHESTGDFTAVTGQPWWSAAATKGTRIELQPIEVLRNRGVLESTLHHEYTHAVIDALGHGQTPRWLAEGMAITLAGEGPHLAAAAPAQNLTDDQIDRLFTCDSPAPGPCPPTPAASAQAYAEAYRATQQLIKEKSEAGVWTMIAGG